MVTDCGSLLIRGEQRDLDNAEQREQGLFPGPLAECDRDKRTLPPPALAIPPGAPQFEEPGRPAKRQCILPIEPGDFDLGKALDRLRNALDAGLEGCTRFLNRDAEVTPSEIPMVAVRTAPTSPVSISDDGQFQTSPVSISELVPVQPEDEICESQA
jgi:hypothetical protein